MNILIEKFGVGINCGADTVPAYLAEEFSKDGINVYLTEGVNLWTDEHPDDYGYKLYNSERRDSKTYFNIEDLCRELYTNYCDIIHSHTRSRNLIKINENLKKWYNIPMVHTIHGMDSLYDGLDIEMMNMANLVTAPSKYACEMIKNIHPWSKNKVLPIPNFTDFTEFTYDNNIEDTAKKLKEKTCQNGEKMILFVGRLQGDKGIYPLADACLNLLNSGENIKLVYVGPDFYEESAREKIYQKFSGREDKIFIRGKIPEEEVDELKVWYKAADMLVLPSDTQHETFGLTPLEALSMETPIIVSDIGGLKEIYVDSGFGIGVRPKNTSSIEKGIRYVLQNYDEEKRRAKIARDIIAKWYSPKFISNIWYQIYDKLNNNITINPIQEDYVPKWYEEIESFAS